VSGEHFRRRTITVLTDTMNGRRREAARTRPSMTSWQVVNVQQAGRVNDRRLMASLGLDHHTVLVLYNVIHRVPRTQAVMHTQTHVHYTQTWVASEWVDSKRHIITFRLHSAIHVGTRNPIRQATPCSSEMDFH